MSEDSQTRAPRSNDQPVDSRVPEQPSATVHPTLPVTNHAGCVSLGPHQNIAYGLATTGRFSLCVSEAAEPWRRTPFLPTETNRTERFSPIIWADTQPRFDSNQPHWNTAEISSHALQLDHGSQPTLTQQNTVSNADSILIADSTALQSIATCLQFASHQWLQSSATTEQLEQTHGTDFYPLQATVLNLQQERPRVDPVQEQPSKLIATTNANAKLNKKKRTRRDAGKKLNKPNNKHGQKGTKGCGPCRAMKRRCYFESEYLPCEYCRGRNIRDPCLKLFSPKKEASLRPLRPVTSSVLSQEGTEVFELVAFAYSSEMQEKDIFLSSLIRQSARRCGRDLPCLSFRYAVAAFSAWLLPPEQFSPHIDKNRKRAARELQAKFKSPGSILDSDVFAVFLVGIVDKFGSGTSTAGSNYVSGLEMVFHNCVKNSKGELSAGSMLRDFGPLLFDWLEFRTLANPHQWQQTYRLRRQIFGDASSFRQRLKYSETTRIQWQSSAGWALRYTISILANKLCSRIAEIAAEELSPEFRRENFREDVLRSIELEREDEVFQNVMKTSESWQEIPTRTLLEKKSMHLIEAILEAPTVLAGLQSAEAGRIACELIAAHEDRNSDNFSYDLLIAGMSLSEKDRPVFGPRVLKCLQRTCPDSVAVLGTFWDVERVTPEMVASVLRPKVC